MKSPVERLLEYIERNYPNSMPNANEQERMLMSEKIQLQIAYNQGFSNAKRIYEKE